MDFRKGSKDNFFQRVEEKRLQCLQKLKDCPLSIMLWGEKLTSDNPISQTRALLRTELESRGHYVKYGEEICDNSSDYSYIGQIASQADAFDIIFSIPTSIGALTEAHSFFMIPPISNKLIIYMNDKWSNEGFSGPTLLKLQSKVTASVKVYNENNLKDDIIKTALQEVHKIQEASILFSKSTF